MFYVCCGIEQFLKMQFCSCIFICVKKLICIKLCPQRSVLFLPEVCALGSCLVFLMWALIVHTSPHISSVVAGAAHFQVGAPDKGQESKYENTLQFSAFVTVEVILVPFPALLANLWQTPWLCRTTKIPCSQQCYSFPLKLCPSENRKLSDVSISYMSLCVSNFHGRCPAPWVFNQGSRAPNKKHFLIGCISKSWLLTRMFPKN